MTCGRTALWRIEPLVQSGLGKLTHFQLQAEDDAMEKEEKTGEEEEIRPKPKPEKKVVIQPQPQAQEQ